MANILDIFRTHTGEQLLKRCSSEIGEDKIEDFQQAFIYLFPTLLVCFEKTEEIPETDPANLIQFIEKGHFISSGKKVVSGTLNEELLEIIHSGRKLINIDQSNFQKLTYVAAGVLSCIIHEIKSNEKDARLSEIIRTLSGSDIKYDSAFINTLIKENDNANLIDSSEKIALDSDNDKDDQSILGGYAGGR